MKKQLTLIAICTAAFAVSSGAIAASYEVKMLNRGSDGEMMVFEPSYLHVEPGDTVTFTPADPAHNAESIPGMAPEGGETFHGAMSKPVSVTFTKPGVYGVKCMPHYPLGMVALVKVGDGPAPNLAAAEKVRLIGKATARMQALFDKAK